MNEQHAKAHADEMQRAGGRPHRDGHRAGFRIGDRVVWEKRPGGTLWGRRHLPDALRADPNVLTASSWRRRAVSVLSALELAEYPREGDGAGPQWHVSIAAGVGERELRRPTEHELRVALHAFGMAGDGVDEDNHHPGNARHFWLPVDPAKRVSCQCKVDEKTITEPDGYQWTTPVDGPCRGCELAALEIGKACPIHGEAVGVEKGAPA